MMMPRMKTPLPLGFACTTLGTALLTGGPVRAQQGTPFVPRSNNVLTVAVYGDFPYGTSPTDRTETDLTSAFIASINADPKVELVLHVVAIHSSNQYCTARTIRKSSTCGRRSRIRSSTHPATTRGRTATRPRKAAAFEERRLRRFGRNRDIAGYTTGRGDDATDL
jgi:hypothetical protein